MAACTNTWRIPGGYLLKDLTFQVPVDHFGRATSVLAPLLAKAPTMTVAAREIVSNNLGSDPKAKKKPYLVYLQGGPGFPSPSPTAAGLPGWVGRAVKDYTVLLLDQRGTGNSTPITSQTIGHLTPEQQAEYLSMFRSDSIVQDLEAIRQAVAVTDPKAMALSNAPQVPTWSLLGQSYGGFIITNYLHMHPTSLKEVFYTGGLPITAAPVGGSSQTESSSPNQLADELYRCTWKRVIKRNQTYYKKYPQDVVAIKTLLTYLHKNKTVLPSGGDLTPRRFLLLGLKFGFEGGFDAVHHLVESAFVAPALSEHTTPKLLSQNFIRDVESLGCHFDTNPIYATLHESIYCDGPGQQSLWSAERIMKSDFSKEFHLEAFLASAGQDASPEQPVFFFGEMVFSWMFDDFAQLRNLKESSQMLAAKKDWPHLYNRGDALESLEGADIPRAAAVIYHDDMYVEQAASIQTATEQLLPVDVRMWVTNEYDHGGLRVGGATVLDRLIGLANGTIDPR